MKAKQVNKTWSYSPHSFTTGILQVSLLGLSGTLCAQRSILKTSPVSTMQLTQNFIFLMSFMFLQSLPHNMPTFSKSLPLHLKFNLGKKKEPI